jgi:hypothetical protein
VLCLLWCDSWSLASAFAIPSRELFAGKGLFEPRVTKYEIGQRRGFLVERVVIKPDQRVYAVSEFVRGDGFCEVRAEKVLIEDSTTIGIIFLGVVGAAGSLADSAHY